MGAPGLPPTWQLYLKDHRMSTFKNWPFLEDCSCTPERVSRPVGAKRPHPGPDGALVVGSGIRDQNPPTLAPHC